MGIGRKHGVVALLAAGLAWGLLVPAARAADEPAEKPPSHKNLATALKEGRYGVTLRYRFAFVEDDLFEKDAVGSTLRTTLWYESARFHRLRAYLEFQDVSNLGAADLHNDTMNGVTDRPVIADPDDTNVLQGWLAWDGLAKTELLAGRKAVNLDDQRFVGSVAWRQNHQALDTVLLTQKSIPRTRLTYAWVDNVLSVLGTHRPMDSHLLNVAVDAGPAGEVAAYYYRLDFNDAPETLLSSATVGASLSGTADLGAVDLPYRLELAKQTDVGTNPDRIDADYARLELGVHVEDWKVRAGYELLGGSTVDGQFNTPLATLHKFNGWADRFLVTPADGLEDLWVSAGWGRGRFAASLIYHRFDADTGSERYGNELDGLLTWNAPWKQSFALKFAAFDGRNGRADVNKIWLYTSYKFGHG